MKVKKQLTVGVELTQKDIFECLIRWKTTTNEIKLTTRTSENINKIRCVARLDKKQEGKLEEEENFSCGTNVYELFFQEYIDI